VDQQSGDSRGSSGGGWAAPEDAAIAGRLVVERAVRGESEAIASLWREHRRWVAAVILAHKPREADVEDLLQDVAMTFVRSVSQLRDQATLKPWLRTVAINAALAAGRRETRRREGVTWKLGEEHAGGARMVGEAGGGLPLRGADEHALVNEESARISALACELPEGYREPLLFKCVRGMSYREIGAVMGLPETTVETRIARARRMLRELVESKKAAGPARGGADGDAGGGDVGVARGVTPVAAGTKGRTT
jgi:RNA polymerase sigma-70 factor (ECF subfamily)